MSEGQQLLEFLHDAEKLKTVLRHSWLSSGRRESVAEHSWRMALMAMMLNQYLKAPTDLLKTLKLTLVHDLVEVHYQDNPAFKKQPDDKAEQERKALTKIVKPLPRQLAKELMDLWEEYEARATPEAKLATALDKLEVLIQHNEADVKYMNKKELAFNFTHGVDKCAYDSFLNDFRALLNDEFIKNYEKNKIDPKHYRI
jgi:putative hydrolase of HD superfamily